MAPKTIHCRCEESNTSIMHEQGLLISTSEFPNSHFFVFSCHLTYQLPYNCRSTNHAKPNLYIFLTDISTLPQCRLLFSLIFVLIILPRVLFIRFQDFYPQHRFAATFFLPRIILILFNSWTYLILISKFMSPNKKFICMGYFFNC